MPEPDNTIQHLRSEYEEAVRSIASRVAMLRQEGLGEESIARLAHKERQRLTLAFKERTPEPLRSRIVERTVAEYGHASGPSIESLRQQGKSWSEIADGASRPGEAYKFKSCGYP